MKARSNPGELAPLDFSRWRRVPDWLMGGGLVLCVLGLLLKPAQFGFSWLLAFMFFLSVVLGAAFLVMMHHLFDAGWSVGIRRFCEHLACLVFPWMVLLFIPIAVLAPKIYSWMTANPLLEHDLSAKWPLFTQAGFYLAAALCLAVWSVLAWRLRYWSLKQDEDGAAQCTRAMRFHSGWGIFAFGCTLTLASIMWIQAVQYQWFSTMYGVYYFAGCAWVAFAAAYVIAMILDRQGLIHDTMGGEQYYYLGSLLFAFTVFSAYIHFSQYFVIWNANMPEETFWYVLREKGTWWAVGLILVFGHFLVPFLSLLRIDVKLVFRFMVPLCIWIALMQYVDLTFNIMPALHPNGVAWQWLWLDAGCVAFIGGVLTKAFLWDLNRYAPYPIKDPRLAEAMGLHPEVPRTIPEVEPTGTDGLPGVQPHLGGGGQ
jgi:hypothetical protein